jgi:hypothetical protein
MWMSTKERSSFSLPSDLKKEPKFFLCVLPRLVTIIYIQLASANNFGRKFAKNPKNFSPVYDLKINFL